MLGLKKEVTSNLIKDELYELQKAGFSRGRSVKLSRASKVLALSSSGNTNHKNANTSLEGLLISSSNPAQILGEIFADYEKLMGLQSGSSTARRLERKLTARLYSNVTQMKRLISQGSKSLPDLPDVTLIEKALEQIYLLLLQHSFDIPDFLLTSQVCQAIAHHPKAKNAFFTSLTGIGDIAVACKRIQKEDKILQREAFQFLEKYVRLSDMSKLLLSVNWIALPDLLVEEVYSSSSKEWREIRTSDVIRVASALFSEKEEAKDSSSPLMNRLRIVTDALTSSPSSSYILPSAFSTTNPILRHSASLFTLLRTLFLEAETCYRAERFGLSQQKFTLVKVIAEDLLQSSSSFLQAVSEHSPRLSELYEASRWREDLQSFLRDCSVRCTMNIVACKLKRQTKPPAPIKSTPSNNTPDQSKTSLIGDTLAKNIIDSVPSQLMTSLLEKEGENETVKTSEISHHVRYLTFLYDSQRYEDIQREIQRHLQSSSSPLLDQRRREEIEEQLRLLAKEKSQNKALSSELFDFQYRQTADVFFFLFLRRMQRRVAQKLSMP